MKQVIQDFLVRVRGGMDIEKALDLLQHSLHQEHFQDLIMAIRFNFRYRGDLPVLLEHLEMQMNHIEEEYTRRRLSNAHDRNLTVVILIVVPFVFVFRYYGQAGVQTAFQSSSLGAGLAIMGAIAYLSAIGCAMIIQRKINH
ncbi:MAG: hypothetical protein VB070_04935 [Clostridiaceae bacterium]|nr:hypothetical protein [Clostridiaceae bacterium]